MPNIAPCKASINLDIGLKPSVQEKISPIPILNKPKLGISSMREARIPPNTPSLNGDFLFPKTPSIFSMQSKKLNFPNLNTPNHNTTNCIQ